MQIEGKVRLIALQLKNSFQHLVPSVLHLGSKPDDPLQPLLILETQYCITEFRVAENVKHIYTNALVNGRVGIEFIAPPHYLLINTNDTKLPDFVELLYALKDQKLVEEFVEYIPTIRSHGLKMDVEESTSNSVILFMRSCRPMMKSIYKPVPVDLRNKLSTHVKEIDLPNCNLNGIPADLGLISVQYVNLKGNRLCNADLTWLEELPIRNSLIGLNLSNNKIAKFPSVLVEFQSMISLNFCDNCIDCIPIGIHHMRCLKYLNISGNNIRYLPGTMELLRLMEFDATYNHLTCNECFRPEPEPPKNTKSCLRLTDIAALSVDPECRQRMTNHNYPGILLEILRSVTKCYNCDRRVVPRFSAQFFVQLPKIKFALIRKIHPQNREFSDIPLRDVQSEARGHGLIFLLHYFCNFCEDEFKQWGCNLTSGCHRLVPLVL